MHRHHLCALMTASHSPEAELIMFCCTGGLVGAATLIWESMAFLGSCQVVV